MKSFSKLIEEACREQGVSNSELARALGRAQSWVPQLFSGKNMLERTFRECARVLDLDVRVELVPRQKAKQRIEARKQKRGLRLRRSNGRE